MAFLPEREREREYDGYRLIEIQSLSFILDFDLKNGTAYVPPLEEVFSLSPLRTDSLEAILENLEVYPGDYPLLEAFLSSLSNQPQNETTLRLRNRDGSFTWHRLAFAVHRDEHGRPTRQVATITDVDEQVHALRQLRYQVEHDPLTGHANLVKFKADAARLLASRSAGTRYAVWYCDFYNFKYINQIYGYQIGDTLLRYWARLLAQNLGPEELFARSMADNFVALCAYQDAEELGNRFDQLAAQLKQFDQLASRHFHVDLVAGCYLIKPDDSLSIDDMLDRANIAQKSIKPLGGSRYAVYSEAMCKKFLYEKELEACMEQALHDGEFLTYLQPQVDIQHGSALFGAEMLVRWKKPGQGLIFPSTFIPLFERNGFIAKLDAYMFEKACAYLSSRLKRGLPPLRISVNISRTSLEQRQFLHHYAAIRNNYAVPSGMLELECTENLVVHDTPLFRHVMTQLPEYGIRRAMDDFGKGYSSLNMLKDITLDVLKLDMDFFREKPLTPRNQSIIRSVVDMARALDMATVAEGIEHEEQVAFLRSIGCDAVQGFFFSPAVPLEEFERLEQEIPRRMKA